MDSTEKKEKKIDFKPSNWLYCFLFIYYSIWLLNAYGAILWYLSYGFDSFRDYESLEWFCFGLFLIAGVYALYAVIKTLRGDRDCIASLKWSLAMTFIYTLLASASARTPVSGIPTWSVLSFIKPLFYLGFYLYLCISKGIKRRYPKSERRFGPSGWVWTGLTCTFLGIGVYQGWQEHQIADYCRRIDVSRLSLSSGEVSDGYVVFRSDRNWEKWTSPADTLYIDNCIATLPTMMSADSLSTLYLASGRCDRADARAYNQVIVASTAAMERNIGRHLGKMKELSFIDTIVAGKRVMSTIYVAEEDSLPACLDIVMITETDSPKCCVVMRTGINRPEKDWAAGFAKNLRFDLKAIANGEDDEEDHQTKNEDSHRTSNQNRKSDTYMHGSLLHGLAPRLLFRIMTLENHEREIADRKGSRIFNYL